MKTTPRSRTIRRRLLAIAIAAAIPLSAPTATVHADEFGSSTRLYEDDAWYDVTEWFDGNDYNPTDEAIGRIDNETRDASEELSDGDSDNDWDWSDESYGYYENNDNDWYYDYTDYGYTDNYDYDNNGYYDYTADYYDNDQDGVYDSSSEFTDSDHDGVYDKVGYVWFADANKQADSKNQTAAKNSTKSRSSQVMKLQGSIKAAKKVRTPNGTNLVVVLTDTNSGQDQIVDLGSIKQYDTMPRLGQNMQVEAAKFQTGEKTVLLATKATREGVVKTIDRSGRQYTGTVSGMKSVKARGNQYQMAKITTDAGKKMLVDLGQDGTKLNLKEGQHITVNGPAVRVKDRLLLVARKLESDGKSVDLKRGALK